MRWLAILLLSTFLSSAQTNIVINETNILVQTYASFYSFSGPSSLAMDASRNLYVVDGAYIRKISTNNIVTTLAQLTVHRIACDPTGNVWGINAQNGAVYKIYPDGDYVSPFGLSRVGIYGDDAIGIDSAGNVYVTDTGKHVVKRFDTNNNLSVFAGQVGIWGNLDGCSTNAKFTLPSAITIDGNDNIYVYSNNPQSIRKITPAGCVSTYCATTNDADRYFDGEFGFATFSSYSHTPNIKPLAISIVENGSIYIASGVSIRRISPSKSITTVAGHYFLSLGYSDGVGSEAKFRSASGIVATKSGELFIADGSNYRIRRIVISDPPRVSFGIYPVVTIDSLIGRQYRIESSIDMTNWITSETITATTSPHHWIDQNLSTSNKFYRAVLLP